MFDGDEGREGGVDAASAWLWRAALSVAVTAATVAVYLGTLSHDDALSARSLLAAGALYTPALTGGEPWRLLSAAFVHAHPASFVADVLVVLGLGRALEMRLGTLRLAVVLVLTALGAGATASLFADGPVATGACLAAGVATASAVVASDDGQVRRQWLATGVTFIFMTLLVCQIDPAASTPGVLAGGNAGGLTTLGLRLAAGGSLRLFGAATLLALLIADGVVTARALDPFRPVVDQLGVAEVEAQRGRREDARRFLIDAERRHARASPPDDLRVRRVMGLWLTLGDPDRAADAVLDAVDRAPGQARIVSLLAGLYLHEGAGRFDRIVDAHRRALAATPDAIVANNLAWLLLHPPAGTPPADAEALRLARDAVASDQERTSALLHTLAVAEARAGDASRVRPLLMRAAALAPDDAPFYRREADRLASAPQSPVASPSP